MVTAVNRTWDTTHNTEAIKSLKNIPPKTVGNAAVDYISFIYLIKKHTTELHEQASSVQEGNTYKTINNLAVMLTGYSFTSTKPSDEGERKALMKLSDEAFDLKAMADFYNHVRENHSDKLNDIAQAFPNTLRGNYLCKILFNRSVNELQQNPDLTARATIIQDTKEVSRPQNQTTSFKLDQKETIAPEKSLQNPNTTVEKKTEEKIKEEETPSSNQSRLGGP